jgi:hypothetical protein
MVISFFRGGYCNVNIDKALELLSVYFHKHLMVPDKKMVSFFENRMGYLIYYFRKNPVNYIPQLIKQTAGKNRVSGLRLKEMMLNYFHSNLVVDYDVTLIQENIRLLNSILI